MNNIYMQNILDHFHNPENFGPMIDATHIQEEDNPFCGDKITVYLKIIDSVIVDIKFEGQGCAISQAAMSMLTELVKGKFVDEVKKIKKEDITEMLGIDLSPTRLKCALLGWQALKKIISAT